LSLIYNKALFIGNLHNSMSNIEQKTIGDSVLLFEQNLLANVSIAMFSPQYWHDQHKVIGQAMGRGVTTFFQENGRDFVLRHYRRGGLIGKLLSNQYLYTGLYHTRAWQEMQLLNTMYSWGLPVPRAAAAKINKRGLVYTADIILEKIPEAQDVFNVLNGQPLSSNIWQQIGAVIKQLHDKQVFHHDLNIHNIMLDIHNKVWLIDFDKCQIQAGESWKAQNLQRLLRSLRKEKNKNPSFFWQETQWQWCMEGYHSINP
jgi:3-deoxy-D-manno-octulosonic acid kinase